ncbi:CCDC90 family protein [Methylobacterium sp. J-077]|uniref:CCDC90 family protein n=1 Tax=Methylobacterium sp. J-077 TaxID=2836656 RepID=UPI001FBB0C4B|nr:CCDC90 family protein [Methylobacterium sp. J-077]MCJ2123592.1 CCDC90 family protein [Methylobacterium sp. J-077]
MSLVSLDTLAIARKLQAAGFSDVQAEAMTGVLRDAHEADLSTLVTKVDLKTELGLLKSELGTDTALVRSDLNADSALLRSDLKSEIALVRSDLRTEIADTKYEILKWVLSAIGFQTIVVVGAIVALTKSLH